MNGKKPPKVLFYTNACDAQSTLARTIESILAQTRGDWVWHLVDNGSADATGEMIREAARRDGRIVALANRKNHVVEPGNGWWEISDAFSGDEFLCFIDADDEYKPDFIEKTRAFAVENDLDVACCGSDFIDWRTGKVTSTRILKRDLLIEGDGFSTDFAVYHQFMRTMWGKLYRLRVMRGLDSARIPGVYYSWDTLFAQECFRTAARVGILAESLHKYHVRPGSLSSRWDRRRVETDAILLKLARDFLTDKCGSVTPGNEDFLLAVYMNALTDTLDVLLKSGAPGDEKLAAVLDVFSREDTKRLAARERLGVFLGIEQECAERRRALFATAADFLLRVNDAPDERLELFFDAGEFVCAACRNADGWIFFKKLRARFLLENGRADEARTDVGELAKLLPADAEIADLARRIDAPSFHP
ncbi:MAG: glycosyltransferase family 2 protein [Candidatus Accumulibacter sp.]|jgi:hypothetical protein|nr:glycosyltransferase family 2 protein [Accumulibacter sp.]